MASKSISVKKTEEGVHDLESKSQLLLCVGNANAHVQPKAFETILARHRVFVACAIKRV